MHACSSLSPSRLGVCSLLAVAATALTSYAIDCNAQPAPSDTGLRRVSLRLDWSWYPYQAGFMIAAAKGYYRNAGIDVKIEQGQGSASTVALVASGKDDFGFADSSTVVLSINKGMPVKIVQMIRRDAGFGVTCMDKFKITTPAQLEGHSVLMTPGEAVAQVWPAFVRANRLDATKIKVVNAPSSGKINVFAQGSIADCVAGVPIEAGIQAHLLNPAVAKGGIDFARFGIHLFGHAVIANDEFLRSNRDLVRKFLAATASGFKEMCADPEASAAIFIRRVAETGSPLPPPTQEWAKINMPLECDIIKPSKGSTWESFGETTDADWQKMLNVLHETGALADVKAPSTYYTNDFLR